MTIAAFAVAFVIAAPASASFLNNSDQPVQFPLGEWVDVDATRTYQFELAAGMALELKVGQRLTPTDVFVFGPEDSGLPGRPTTELPGSGKDAYAVHTLPGSDHAEYVSVVSKTGGTFVLQVNIRPVGKTSIFLSKPRPATAKDHAAAEAARIMFEIGASRRGKRTPESVVEASKRRVELHRLLNDPESLAWVLNQHTAVMEGAVRMTEALSARIEARSIYLEKNDFVMAVNFSPCYLYEAIGDIQAWIHCAHEDLSYARRSGSKLKEAEALRAAGFTYHKLADEARASEYYTQSLLAWRALIAAGSASGANEVMLLRDLGSLKRGTIQLGRTIDFFPERTGDDMRRSLAYYREALDLDTNYRTGFRPHLLHQIGVVYRELGMHSDAANFLSQSIAAYGTSTGSVALVSLDVARLHINKGETSTGIKLVESVLPELRRRGISIERVAGIYLDAGDAESAGRLYSEMLAENRRVQKLSDICVALFGLARVQRELGNFNNARLHILEAIAITDSLRNRITNDEIRSVYFAAVKTYYDFYIDLLMQAHRSQPDKGFDRTALDVSEKARSRNLLDMLTLSGVDIKAGVDPALLEHEKEARKQLAAAAAKLSRASSDAKAAEVLRAEVSSLATVHQAIESEIKKKSPQYAALTQPSFATVSQIQELLDPGTVFLEYFLGEKKSYLWVVGNDRIDSFDLPSRSVIETQVREIYRHVTVRNTPGTKTEMRSARNIAADADFQKRSAELSETIVGPAIDLIQNKRLVVVPDGALNYVSFPALSLNNEYLGQRHEIIVEPSASALAMLRQDKRRVPASKLLAVFADPIFSPEDARIYRRFGRSVKPERQTAMSRDFVTALKNTGNSGLLRLPFSRREAENISRSAPKGLTLKQVDFDAAKENVFTAGLDQYRIVHFATHGLLDSRHPSLSGLVLSLVNKNGTDVDGFLRLQDIYNLGLNADLVVLSACETALGQQIRGEGIVGLTRGFMYAGAKRVVASLWKVDDAATAHLMSVFYRRMLVDNMRPAAALRAAQNEMMKQPRWKSPYYWAPFVLQGEWK